MRYLKQLFLFLIEEIDPGKEGRHTVAMGGAGSWILPHFAETPRSRSSDLDRSGLEIERQTPGQFML